MTRWGTTARPVSFSGRRWGNSVVLNPNVFWGPFSDIWFFGLSAFFGTFTGRPKIGAIRPGAELLSIFSSKRGGGASCIVGENVRGARKEGLILEVLLGEGARPRHGGRGGGRGPWGGAKRERNRGPGGRGRSRAFGGQKFIRPSGAIVGAGGLGGDNRSTSTGTVTRGRGFLL